MVVGAAADTHARMQVAGQRVEPGVTGRVVAQREATDDQRLVDDVDAKTGRRIAGAPVMVAAHERQRKLRVRGAPARQRAERRRRVRMRRMQKVAEKNDAQRVMRLHQRRELVERLARGATRHGNAELAKRHRLADVRVGDEQRTLRRPPDRLLRQQVKRLAADFDAHRRCGDAHHGLTLDQPTSKRNAASRCSVGLRLKPERA